MPKQNNASYENCISELHSRYDGRGVKVNAAREAAGQIKKESSVPNAYLVSRMSRNGIAEQYKNGEYNGQKYMTTGDFLKYYNNRKTPTAQITPVVAKSEKAQTKEFKRAPMQEANRAQSAHRAVSERTTCRPAMKADRFDPKAKTIAMPSVSEQKGLRAKVAGLVSKWFPTEDKKESTTTFKRNVPVAAIGLILSSTIAMTMIISSTVMASQASMQVSDLKYEIEALSEESDMLEEKLMKKENLAEIKEYATDTLGMISKDYVSAEYISISSGSSVENRDVANDVKVDFSTLLSAIFGE